MTDTFRALCAELLSEIQALRRAVADEVGCSSPEPSVIARTRAALAQPEPEGKDCPGCEGTPVASNSPCAVCGRAQPEPPTDKEVAALKNDAECAEAEHCDLLARPEPQGPTESDVTELFYRHMGEGSQVGFENAVAEALARWGRPASKSE